MYPKLPPRHGQRVHADELSPKGVPEKDVPDDKWEAEAGRLCPYCGVTNDNAETGLNHIRKHLDVMLVCGGCHTKERLPGAGTPEAYER